MRSIPVVTPIETDQHLTNHTHSTVQTETGTNVTPTACHHHVTIKNPTAALANTRSHHHIQVVALVNHQLQQVVVVAVARLVVTTIVVDMDTIEVPLPDPPLQVPPHPHNHHMEGQKGLSTTSDNNFFIKLMEVMEIEQNIKGRMILRALAQALVVALAVSWVEVVYLWLRICMVDLNHLSRIKAPEMRNLVSGYDNSSFLS